MNHVTGETNSKPIPIRGPQKRTQINILP